VGDWTNQASGDVDWIKCRIVDGVRVCVGVEVQVSARSDLIFRDIVHFQKQMREGEIDVFSELSHLYTETTLLTEILKNRRHDQSSGDSFEVEVMLKNALRILRDVMSHLPS